MKLARPVLENASAAWYSITDTAAGKLEAIQRRGARFVGNLKRTDRTTSTTVSGLMKYYGWASLVLRWETHKLKVFIDMHFRDQNPIKKYLQISTTRTCTLRSHDPRYFVQQKNSDYHRRSYFIKTARQWNKLPASCSLLKSLMQYPMVIVDNWRRDTDDEFCIAGEGRRWGWRLLRLRYALR